MTEIKKHGARFAELKKAIDENDAKAISNICVNVSTSDVLIMFGLDSARIFYQHAMHNKKLRENKYGFNHILQCLISEHPGEYQVVIDYIKLIREFHSDVELNIYDEEIIRYMMQFYEALEVIKACIDYNIEIDFEDCFVLSANIHNVEMFHFMVDNVEIDTGMFEVFLLYWLREEPQYDNENAAQKDEYTNVIARIINEFNFNVNIEEGNEYEYLVHECLYSHPFAVHLFFTDKFDASLLEDEEFWEGFSEMLDVNDVKYYLVAFQNIKACGIKFDDSIMLDALKSAGHDALIHAYLN